MSHEEERRQEGSTHLLIRASMILGALRFAVNYPKPVHRVPAEIFVRNRIREASPAHSSYLNLSYTNWRQILFVKYAQPEDVIRDIDEGGVSRTPLVAINELRSYRSIMWEDASSFATGTRRWR